MITVTEERVHLTMRAEQVAEVDEWRRKQPDIPPRAEAIRRLVRLGMGSCDRLEDALGTLVQTVRDLPRPAATTADDERRG